MQTVDNVSEPTVDSSKKKEKTRLCLRRKAWSLKKAMKGHERRC
jgi:hypothetical protein